MLQGIKCGCNTKPWHYQNFEIAQLNPFIKKEYWTSTQIYTSTNGSQMETLRTDLQYLVTSLLVELRSTTFRQVAYHILITTKACGLISNNIFIMQLVGISRCMRWSASTAKRQLDNLNNHHLLLSETAAAIVVASNQGFPFCLTVFHLAVTQNLEQKCLGQRVNSHAFTSHTPTTVFVQQHAPCTHIH